MNSIAHILIVKYYLHKLLINRGSKEKKRGDILLRENVYDFTREKERKEEPLEQLKQAKLS